MSEALKNLALDAPYRTGPLGRTDLHAGGNFFCVVYRECLQFSADGRVRRWCEVIDDSYSFHDEPKQLRATDVVGSYHINQRGYLECVFPNLRLTGLPCKQAPGLLAFHAFKARPDVSWPGVSLPSVSFSLVYSCGAMEAEPGAPVNQRDGIQFVSHWFYKIIGFWRKPPSSAGR